MLQRNRPGTPATAVLSGGINGRARDAVTSPDAALKTAIDEAFAPLTELIDRIVEARTDHVGGTWSPAQTCRRAS